MTGFRQVIEADRAGFLQHLDSLIEAHRQARTVAAQAGKRSHACLHEAGVVEGLEIARRAVASWHQIDDPRSGLTVHQDRVDLAQQLLADAPTHTLIREGHKQAEHLTTVCSAEFCGQDRQVGRGF